MKLNEFLNQLGLTHTGVGTLHNIPRDFADKEFELNFLGSLPRTKAITDFSKIKQVKIQNLIDRNLVKREGDTFELTKLGRQWLDGWENHRSSIVTTFGAMGYNQRGER